MGFKGMLSRGTVIVSWEGVLSQGKGMMGLITLPRLALALKLRSTTGAFAKKTYHTSRTSVTALKLMWWRRSDANSTTADANHHHPSPPSFLISTQNTDQRPKSFDRYANLADGCHPSLLLTCPRSPHLKPEKPCRKHYLFFLFNHARLSSQDRQIRGPELKSIPNT